MRRDRAEERKAVAEERKARAKEAKDTVRAAVGKVLDMLARDPNATAGKALDLLLRVHGRLVDDSAARGATAVPRPRAPVDGAAPAPFPPAVPIEGSVTDDHIVCLEDGSRHRALKRHLRWVHGITPKEYRARWGLPRDYPMTAPGYARRQREAAHATGFSAARPAGGETRRRRAGVAEGVLRTERQPAVPIEESVTDDYIVCLEDGERRVMLKRHLRRAHNLTPEAYRARWGLPPDYPMVAPGYARIKRAEAHAVGLGTDENKRGKRAGARGRLVGSDRG